MLFSNDHYGTSRRCLIARISSLALSRFVCPRPVAIDSGVHWVHPIVYEY